MIDNKYSLEELNAPFEGLQPVRNKIDLIRTRIWRFEGGLLRALKITSPLLQIERHSGAPSIVTVIGEVEDNPGYVLDYVFNKQNSAIAAYSKWGISTSSGNARIHVLKTGLKRLSDVDVKNESAEIILEQVDDARKQPGEMLLFSKDLIVPDIFTIDGLFAALATRTE